MQFNLLLACAIAAAIAVVSLLSSSRRFVRRSSAERAGLFTDAPPKFVDAVFYQGEPLNAGSAGAALAAGAVFAVRLLSRRAAAVPLLETAAP